MLKQLFAKEEQKVERFANSIRFILSFVYIGTAFSFKNQISPGAFNAIIIVALLNLAYVASVYLELKKEHPANWVKSTSILLDIVLLSVVVYSFGAYRTFKTDVFLLYFLWIGMAAMKSSIRLTLVAGGLSMTLYFLIASIAINTGSIELGTFNESLTTHRVSQSGLAIQLISLAVFAMLAGLISFMFRDITARAVREDLLEEKNTKLNVTLHKLRSTQKQLAARNRELATLYEIDALTQLFNRRKIDLILQEAIIESDNTSEPLTLIMLDIDLLKQINDEYGHQTGDRIIRSIADHLRLTARGNDNIGRWGGEKYLIVCPDTDHEAAQILSERLRKRIETCDFDIKAPVTCSLGVTVHHKGETATALLKRADDALLQAKEAGKNQVCIL
ncbi:MAG: GGDEF domain-containing protein [Gammaproteobacteria bacterium]|nr:GGDEF domain-containing protein [Gammaproteobacteria bacterium]